ncbi:C69 family dipeptidase [Microbulbifer yueqingensis]|uniref:Dipeptidase n=1 Tax=Microbulbifer yueqingensis TaxID=658219 RepID=A0A1G9E2F1_9GAMM|nr:C69 family dipeptidase [Microbulbifer yueqingensis]SDK70279.1 Dipeptidase [Microbulbifer yueqingensis]
MCDTMVYRAGDTTWLAKNSDRDPLEAQRVEVIPAVRGDRASSLRCTWIEIPQVPDRHACIIGRPAWMWGAEMGVNECGVAIGNEAIFSRRVMRSGVALLGMDLVRLALERADTAASALRVIVDLLEEFGQGGPAAFSQRNFRYDNSFLIADATEAWKLETAGREWVARRVEHYDAISNGLTIGTDHELASEAVHTRGTAFDRDNDTRLVPFVGACRRRRSAALAGLAALDAQRVGFADFAAILRHHRRGRPSGNADLCMHAAPPGALLPWLRPSQTVNAMIVSLGPGGPRAAFTGTANTCCSLFRPVDFTGGWATGERDSWEAHRVWCDHAIAGEPARRRLQARLEVAEGEIFSALERGDTDAARQRARHWWDAVFAGMVLPDNNGQLLQEIP